MKKPAHQVDKPRKELLGGVNPRKHDRNALMEATLKNDTLLEYETKQYLAKKGEKVYVHVSRQSYTIYSTLVRKTIARVTPGKFHQLFNSIHY